MTAAALRLGHGADTRDTVPGFIAALMMHAALIGWMWIAVQWHTNASPPAIAELWELAPIEPPAPPAPPEPAAPAAQAPAPPKPDIVEKREVPPKKAEAPPKRENKPRKPTPEQLKRQREEAEKRHAQEMARLTSEAGPVARTPMVASSGPISNEYSARIQAAVRAHLFYAVPEGVPASVYAEFKVFLLPTGEQASEPELVKSSGVPGFDDAARRAILRTDPFPRRDDGTVPRTLSLQLYPQDTR